MRYAQKYVYGHMHALGRVCFTVPNKHGYAQPQIGVAGYKYQKVS